MDEILLKSRLRKILDVKGSNANSLAKLSGVRQSTLNPQINGEASVTLVSIYAVLGVWPDISADYLLLGRGEMFALENDKQSTSNASSVGYINSPGAHHNNNTVIGSPGALSEGSSVEQASKIEKLQADIEERDAKIGELQQEKDYILNERDARIRALEDELRTVRSENSKLVEANYKLIMGN